MEVSTVFVLFLFLWRWKKLLFVLVFEFGNQIGEFLLNHTPLYYFHNFCGLPGSSRQLVGFSTEIDEFIINSIWERAGEFFPILREISLSDFKKSREVRVGLRPYSKYLHKKIVYYFNVIATSMIFLLSLNWCNHLKDFVGFSAWWEASDWACSWIFKCIHCRWTWRGRTNFGTISLLFLPFSTSVMNSVPIICVTCVLSSSISNELGAYYSCYLCHEFK